MIIVLCVLRCGDGVLDTKALIIVYSGSCQKKIHARMKNSSDRSSTCCNLWTEQFPCLHNNGHSHLLGSNKNMLNGDCKLIIKFNAPACKKSNYPTPSITLIHRRHTSSSSSLRSSFLLHLALDGFTILYQVTSNIAKRGA